MPYCVPRGTHAQVVKPNGETAAHVCRRDCAFTDEQAELVGYNFHFTKGGYRLVVNAAKVKALALNCSRCGAVLRNVGLCEECKRRGLQP